MKSQINKQQLALEFISVVFAVLLALLLNNWRENIKADRVADGVLENIKQEILTNDTLIRKSMKYRAELLLELKEGRHVVNSTPIQNFPIDVHSDDALQKFLNSELPFSMQRSIETLEVRSNGDRRILIMDDRIYNLQIVNDTLNIMGEANIQLHSANITNQSWKIAQATESIFQMNFELVKKLSELNTLNENYIKTNELALSLLYTGEPGIISVMEDMLQFEKTIITAHEKILPLLH